MKTPKTSISSSKQKQKSLKINNDQKIQRELDTVYIDSSGGRHLTLMKALCSQAQIDACIDRKLQKKTKDYGYSRTNNANS